MCVCVCVGGGGGVPESTRYMPTGQPRPQHPAQSGQTVRLPVADNLIDEDASAGKFTIDHFFWGGGDRISAGSDVCQLFKNLEYAVLSMIT